MNSSYIVKMLAEISTIMNENKDRLIELDSVVGCLLYTSPSPRD